MTKLVDLVRQNWMALSIGATIFIAKIYPYLGSTGGPLRPEYTFKLIGVGVLFFLTFLHLPIQQILSSLKNWKAHIFIQAFSFIILPIVGSWTLVPFTKWFLEIYWIFTIPPHIATDISQGILLLLCKNEEEIDRSPKCTAQYPTLQVCLLLLPLPRFSFVIAKEANHSLF